MTDDDRLDAALRAYYRRLDDEPAPDLLGRVMMATDPRRTWWRRWGAAGGGALALAAAGAVVAVALLNHRGTTPPAPGPGSSPSPSASASAQPSPTAAPTLPAVTGPPVQGFVPSDVTAISAAEWWVLGGDGQRCGSETCVRILHTTDGGQTFTSLPLPAIPNGGLAIQLRFADASDGWAIASTGSVWSTHDGGSSWSQASGTGHVVDLEASGGKVYAITCAASVCGLESSPASQDAWAPLPGSQGTRDLRDLLVNGSHIWAVDGAASATSLLSSSNGGQTFTTEAVCPGDLGISSVYAVDSSVVWATCATGTQAAVLLSTDSGQHFTNLGDPGIENSATIAGVSSSIAVVGQGQSIVRSTDGGHRFTTVATANGQFSVVGFTTSADGFAFELPASGVKSLWRTDDAGATWHQVRFP